MKRLTPKEKKTTIFLPPEVLKAVKEKAKGAVAEKPADGIAAELGGELGLLPTGFTDCTT